MLTILSLCDHSGIWSRPYELAGYDVRRVDLQDGGDVRLFEALPYPVRGVLAAPPCDAFSKAGARWWAEKGEQGLLDGLAVVDACLRIVAVHRPQWWALENPVGRLQRFLGEPSFAFDPHNYGDPWSKRTYLWGSFNAPAWRPVENVAGDITSRMPDSRARQNRRSATPPGFAQAFFEANP